MTPPAPGAPGQRVMTESFRLHGRAALRPRGRGKQRNGSVAVARVSPAAWQAALRLAGGDRSRLRVVSVTVVVVENRPRGGRTP
jgi:hypothetical protein